MISNKNILIVLAICAIATLPVATVATEYWVGGTSGWAKDIDYKAWASDKVFYVGDSLVFNYTMGNHNVFKVNGTSFSSCIIPPPKLALTTGHDVITLATPGKKWYICGVGTHCADHNMKLVIDVQEAGPAAAPTSGSAKSRGYQAFMAAALVIMVTIAIVV